MVDSSEDNQDVLQRLDALLKRHGVGSDAAAAEIPTLALEDIVDPASINEGGIPTLTEEVSPHPAPSATSLDAVPDAATTPPLDIDALVEQITARVRASVEPAIAESLKTELKARLKAAYNQMLVAALGELRRELERSVAREVRAALNAPPKPGDHA